MSDVRRDGDESASPRKLDRPSVKENELYEEWLSKTEQKDKDEVITRLLPLLKKHAARVIWTILRVNDHMLAEEIALDAAYDIDCFRRESAFSTWFHSRAIYTCCVERKRRRREVPLIVPLAEKILHEREEKPAEASESKRLTPEQQRLCMMRLKLGMTMEEIAEYEGVPRTTLQYRWQEVLAELKKIYGITE